MNNEEKQNDKTLIISRKTVYIAVAIILVVGLAVTGSLVFFDRDPEVAPLPDEEITPGDEITPVEEIIPEDVEVVATVNGEEITREEFLIVLEQQMMQYQMQGVDFDSPEMAGMMDELIHQVLNSNFIFPILLEQKAEEEGITVSEEELDDAYQQFVMDFGGEEILEEQLEAAGMSKGELLEDLEREMYVQNYLNQYMEKYLDENPDQKIDQDEIELAADEVEEHYRQIREQYEQIKTAVEADDPQIPAEQAEMYLEQIEAQYGEILEADQFEDIEHLVEELMREDRAAQMRQEKEQTILMDHLAELEEESEIEKNI